MHEHHRLRGDAGGLEHLLLVGEGVAEDHRRGREIAEHELVALLGDRRRRRDIDDERDALLLGHLGDRGALAGIEGADQELRAVVDQLLGARARHLDVGLGVGVHDREIGQAEVLEDRRRDVDAALAVLPDAGLGAGRGSSTPTLSGPLCARTMLNGAVPASKPAAPAPAAKLRRVTPERAELLGDLRVIRAPPGNDP